jgi:hypothetical protein
MVWKMKYDMESILDQLKQILIKQLEKSGLDTNHIPGFMRSLAKTISLDPQMDHLQINERLQYLGWDGLMLDYHTLQLAVACLEASGLETLDKKPVHWFETRFGREVKPSGHAQI